MGQKPDWVRNVGHLPTVQNQGRYRNSTNNLLAACDHPDISERFALWNDDFFALRPTTVPDWHRGPIAAHKRKPQRRTTYGDGLAATSRLLAEWGYPKPLSYELHVPMWVNRARMAEIVRAALPAQIEALHKRTVYGNVADLGGTRQTSDVKIGDRRTTWPAGAAWVSTSDQSFTSGRVGADLRALFPHPSPYEEYP